MTLRPCSSKASTAQPRIRHCIVPATCGNSGWAPMKAPAKSVPPDMLAQRMSRCAGLPLTAESCANPSVNHACVSADNGEPVEPSARSRERSPQDARSISAFWQLAKNAAPAPKKVALASAAKRQSVVQSGLSREPPGLPSKMQQVVPPSRPLTWQFHMIQPVEEYQ